MANEPINYLQLCNNDIHETGKTLGRGAYGEVVEVVYLGTPCAAKRIHPILEESGGRPEEGFRKECETWSRLRHPNVVQLLGLLNKPSASSKLPMIVMEKMDNSLWQFVETNKRETIPLYVKVDILYQVAKGLVYLHGQRPPVIHRDLSPNNILINLGSMTAKLSDFGVAKLKSHQASKMTSLPGTPAFMPPETLPEAPSPEGYSDRIDVFSYGGVVICMVTHMWPQPLPPNAKKGPGGKLVALNEIERRQKYLDLFTAEEKTYFLGLVKQCLEYDPVDRPASQEMMATLHEVKVAHPSQSYVHLLESLETVTESNRETAKLLQKKTEDMENLQRESSGMQERNKMLQEEIGRLTLELDAASAKLKESEDNVFILQQAIESQFKEQEDMLSRVKKQQTLELTLKEPPRQYPKHGMTSTEVHECKVVAPESFFTYLPTETPSSEVSRAPSQKYHQQPQQPSTQLRPKARSTTKRASKTLLIVDPDTNKPLDLVGVSSSGKSKSPEPTSVTQDAKRVEFMEIIRTSAITDASAPEPSPSTQQDVYRYSREELLSLRFLKICLEPPEGLFFPGAIDLVRRRVNTYH